MKKLKRLKIFRTKKQRLLALFMLVVFLGSIVLFNLIFIKDASAAWWDDNWAYRVRVPVTNNTTTETDVYIVFDGDTLFIDTSDTNKFQADCGDLRFLKENGDLLPYRVVSGCGTANTEVHVNFDKFPTGSQNIYYYYGNPDAPDGFVTSSFSTEASDYTIGTPASEEKGPTPAIYLKFDEGYGTTAFDSSSNGNDGSISSARWKNKDYCIYGNCLFFDGIDDVVTVANANSIDFDSDLADGFTIGMWVRVNSDGESSTGEILDKGTNTYIKVHSEDTDGKADLEVKLDLTTTDANLNITDGITIDRWHHLSVIYDGNSSITVYIDGENSGSNTGSGSLETDTSDLLIGGDSANNFHGFIDEFKIYNYIRTANQIQSDIINLASDRGNSATFGTSNKFLSDGLMGYWNLDEESGNATDNSGHGVTLTNNNTTTLTGGKYGHSGDFESSNSNFFNAIQGSSSTVNTAIVRQNAPTTFGTQDFTSTGFGTPKAALFIMSEAPSEGSVTANASLSIGFTDGVSQFVNAVKSVDNVSPVDTFTQLSNAAVIEEGTTSSSRARASFDSWITDGVRINWASNSGGGNRLVTVILFGGDDLNAKVTSFTTNSTSGNSTNVDLGFVPDLAFFMTGSSGTSTISNAWTSFGFSSNTTPIVNSSVNIFSGDNISTSETFMFAHTNRAYLRMRSNASTVQHSAEVTGYISTPVQGIQVTTRDVNRSADIATLAFKFNDGAEFWAGMVDSPTTTGDHSVTSPGFEPSFVWQFMSNVTALNTKIDGVALGSSTFNSTTSYSNSMTDQDNVSTSVAKSLSESKAVKQNLQNNTTGFTGTLSSMDSSGWTINYTDTQSTSAKWPAMAIGGGNGGSQSATSHDHLNPPESLTISTWIKPESVTADTQFNIVGKWDSSEEGYLLAQYGDEIRMYINSNSNYVTTNSANLSTGVWYHITSIYDAQEQKVKIFINGNESPATTTGTIPSAITNTGGVFHIGAANSTNTAENFYDGKIDDVRIYNRAFLISEITKLYQWSPGPVAHWKLDEGTGTIANDSSTYIKGGTLGGDGVGTDIPTWTDGKYSKGLHFDGTDDYVDVGTEIGFRYSFTAMGWIYLEEDPSAGGDDCDTPIINKQGDLSSRDFELQNECGSWQFRVASSDGSANIDLYADTNANEDIGVWTHVAGVYDSENQTMDIYINGVKSNGLLTNSVPSSINKTNNPVWLGARESVGFLEGRLDDIKLYNYPRSSKQVIEDLNAGTPSPGSPIGSAVARWKFDEGYGTTAYDSNTENGDALDLTLSTEDSAWINDGKFGKAFSAGGSRWLTRADDDHLDFEASEDMTISFWLRSTIAAGGNPTSTEYIINKPPSGTTNGGYAIYANTSGQICFGIDDDNSSFPEDETCTSDDIYDNEWHHVTAVKDGVSSLRMYVDGRQNGNPDLSISATTNTLANSSDFFVGSADAVDNDDDFNGDLDEIQIFRSTLDSSQVKILYNQGFAQTMGTTSTDSSGDGTYSSSNEYCPPGFESTCAPPIAHWKMDENTGTIVNDISGNNLTGNLTSSPATATWTQGVKGAGLKFNGVDTAEEFITVPDADSSIADFGASDSFSISLWVKGDTLTDRQVLVANDGPGYLIQIGGSANSGYALFQVRDGTFTPTVNSGSTSIGDNKWHHVVGIRDKSSTQLHIYVDGILRGVSTDTTTGSLDNTADILIGGTLSFPSQAYMDDVKIFDYALTPAQVAWDYNRGGPVGWWKFDECEGPTGYDSSGFENNGTINPGDSTGANDSVGTCTGGSGEMRSEGANGKRNTSLDFDGTNDNVSITGIGVFNNLTQFTTSAWFKWDSTGSQQVIVNKSTSAHLYINSSNILSSFIGGSECSSGVSISQDVWYYGTVTYDSTNVKIYVNGNLKSTCARTATTGTGDLTIGSDSTPSQYFDGQIDDVKIYNYPQTVNQIRASMNEGAVRFGNN